MKNRTRALIAAAGAAVLAPLLLANTTGPAQAATVSVKIVNHNIGGGTSAGVSWPGGGETASAGTVLGQVQRDSGVDAITMQEACRSQFDYWRNVNGWHGAFAPMTDPSETADTQYCGAADDKGITVLSRWPMIGDPVVTRLPLTSGDVSVDTGKEFNLLCARFDKPGFSATGFWVCTTHLWADGTSKAGVPYDSKTNQKIRRAQAQTIAKKLNTWTKWNRKITLSGDFNSTPRTPAIDKIHRVGRDGSVTTANKFWEADQSELGAWGCAGNESTLCRAGRETDNKRKIDYMFGSWKGLSRHNGQDLALTSAERNGGPRHAVVMKGSYVWTGVS